jgi:hypothetical protein
MITASRPPIWLAVSGVLLASGAGAIAFDLVRQGHASRPGPGPTIEMTAVAPAGRATLASEPPHEEVVTVTGLISFDSRLATTIYVDGERLGTTPLTDVELLPGPHRVRAVSHAGTRTFRIAIESGKIAPDRLIKW